MADKELSEEIGRLQKLQREELCCSSKIDKNENGQLRTPRIALVGPEETSNATDISQTRKRRKHSWPVEKEGISSPSASGQVALPMQRESGDLSRGTLSDGILVNVQQVYLMIVICQFKVFF